jgi:hypothetical protein
MVSFVPLDRIQRLISFFAALVCLLFVATLRDDSQLFLVVQTLRTAAVPQNVGPTDGKLLVRVVDPNRAPMPNARVTVLLIRDDIAYLAGFRVTDPQGAVSFEGLAHGILWILAEADERARASSQLVMTSEPKEITMHLGPSHALTIEVVDDDDAPIANAEITLACSDPLPFVANTDDTGHVTIRRLCPPPYVLKATAPGFESTSRTNVMPNSPATRVSLRKLGWIEVNVIDRNKKPAPLSTIFVAGPAIWPARQVQSDASGYSKISALPAGAYDLRATRQSLVSPISTGIMVERGKGTPVTLTLDEGRMVTVSVTGGLADDAPAVASANVVLVEGGLSSFPLQGRTGLDGTVQLGPFPPVPLSASARAEGFVSPGVVLVGANDTQVRIALLKAGKLTGEVVDNRGFPVPGCSIEVIGTDLAGLPIAETPAAMAFRRAHFAWAIHGPPTLIPAGELGVMPGPIPPIPRGDISLDSRLPSFEENRDSQQLTPWVTDGHGRFSVSPVPPGRISAIVRHPAHVEAISEAVTLAPGGTAHVRVVLHLGGTLEGVVLDDRRFPISGAWVRVTAKEGSSERTSMTAMDGSFAFTAVAPVVIVTASRPESPDKVAYQETLSVAAEERKQVEIVLARERPAMTVRVTDDRGYPIDRVHIRAVSLTTDVSLRRTSFSDSKGNAIIEEAAGIRLRLEVSANGYGTHVETFDTSPEMVEVRLDRGLRVQGEVTSRAGRDRVQGATITAYLPTGTRQVTTNENGMFRLDDLSSGPLRIRVDHESYVSLDKTFEVNTPSDVERPVQLEPMALELAGIVEGEVVDDRGNPVAGARVSKDQVPEYLPVGPLPPGVVVTDEKGKFRLGGLAEGEITLEAFAPGIGRGKEERIAVRKERTTTRVRIRLDPTRSKAGPAIVAGVAVTLAPSTVGPGALVTGVASGSEADRAGIRIGDYIERIDGVVPDDERDAMQRLRGPERQDVIVDIQRENKHLTIRLPRERARQ